MYLFRVVVALLVCLSACTFQLGAQSSSADRWEPAIQAFEKGDKTNQPPGNAVLFIGSSSIRAWKSLATDFPDHKVINRGFGGSQIADSVRYVERIVLPYRPKTVVFYAGDNDLAAGKAPAQLLADFKDFVSKVHKELPKTRIVFVAIKPSPSRWKLKEQVLEANRLIKDYCDADKRLAYADIYTPMLGADGLPRPELFIKDNLHLNAAGYELWTRVVTPYLRDASPKPVTRR